MVNKTYVLAAITVLVLSTIAVVVYNSQFKIKYVVDKNQTSIWLDVGDINQTGTLGGIETWKLYNQSKFLKPSGVTLATVADKKTNQSYTTRTVKYSKNVSIIFNYTFDGMDKDITNIPKRTTIRLINAENLTFQYIVTNISPDGRIKVQLDGKLWDNTTFGNNSLIATYLLNDEYIQEEVWEITEETFFNFSRGENQTIKRRNPVIANFSYNKSNILLDFKLYDPFLDNLSFYYKLNESSGGAKEELNSANNLTQTGTVPTAAGLVNNSRGNGFTNLIYLSLNSGFTKRYGSNDTYTYSVAAYRTSSCNNDYGLISMGDTSNNALYSGILYCLATATPHANAWGTDVTLNYTELLNAWNIYHVIYNGSGDKKLWVYAGNCTTNVSVLVGISAANTQNGRAADIMTIGAHGPGSGLVAANHRLDEAASWNRSLTPAEINFRTSEMCAGRGYPFISISLSSPTPANNSQIFNTSSFTVNSTTVGMNGTLNLTNYLYYSNGSLYSSSSTSSTELATIFSNVPTGYYVINASANFSGIYTSESRNITIYSHSVNITNIPNILINSTTNLSWNFSFNPNITLGRNFTVILLNQNLTTNRILVNATNNTFFLWNTTNTTSGIYYISVVTNDTNNNSITVLSNQFNIVIVASAFSLVVNDPVKYYELGSLINITYNSSLDFCIDLNESFGVYYNFACFSAGTNTTTLNISAFIRNSFNTSQTAVNLSYSNVSNQTLYIIAHQYDDVDSLMLNLTGYFTNGSFPTIKIYVNNSLSNNLVSSGAIANGITTTTNFNGSSQSLNWTSFTFNTTFIRTAYFKIPRGANVSTATMNVTGQLNNYSCFQDDALATMCGQTDAGAYFPVAGGLNLTSNYWYVNYSKPPFALAATNWTIFHGGLSTYNASIPAACWNANASFLQFRMYSNANGSSGFNFTSHPECYNGTGWQSFGTEASSTSGTSCGKPTICTYQPYFPNFPTDGIYQGSFPFIFSGAMYCNSTGSWVNRTTQLGVGDLCIGAIIGEEGMNWRQGKYSNSSSVKVGFPFQGQYTWNQSGSNFTTTQGINFTSDMNNYLATCVPDSDGYCYVPVYISANPGGVLNFTNINITYNATVNPVQLNVSLILDYLNDSVNFTTIPIRFESITNGTLQVNALRYSYASGSNNITLYMHDNVYFNVNNTNITEYSSNWNYDLPPDIDYMEFIPQSASSKNVTPYGQTATIPIINITNYAYARGFNFSMLMNDTLPCINITVSLSNNKSTGILLTNNTWVSLFNNSQYLENPKLFFWADFACTSSSWRTWNPGWYFRACAINTTCDVSVG